MSNDDIITNLLQRVEMLEEVVYGRPAKSRYGEDNAESKVFSLVKRKPGLSRRDAKQLLKKVKPFCDAERPSIEIGDVIDECIDIGLILDSHGELYCKEVAP